jgi:hypothetical protein
MIEEGVGATMLEDGGGAGVTKAEGAEEAMETKRDPRYLHVFFKRSLNVLRWHSFRMTENMLDSPPPPSLASAVFGWCKPKYTSCWCNSVMPK